MNDMVKTKSLEEIFQLKKYEGLNDFNIVDWYKALRERKHVLNVMSGEYVISNDHKSAERFREDSAGLIIIKILENPLRDDHHNVTGGYLINDQSVEDVILNNFYLREATSSSGKLQKLESLIKVWESHFNQVWLTEEALMEQAYTVQELNNISYDSVMNSHEGDYLSQQATITVDMSSTDGDLKREFDNWLSRRREAMLAHDELETRKRIYTQADFKSWKRNKILPCLDLLILSKYYNLKITHPKMGRLLFPDIYDIGIEDKARKTKKDAQKLITSESISRLYSATRIYLREKAEKK